MQLIGYSVMICLDLTLTWSGTPAELFLVLDLHFLTFFCIFPLHTVLTIQKKAMCALCMGNCTLLWYYMACLTNTHSWSINVKLLLSWQFSQAPQRDGHLLYAVLRCWFMRCHLLNIPCPVLAVCSVTEKGKKKKPYLSYTEPVSKCTLQISA